MKQYLPAPSEHIVSTSTSFTHMRERCGSTLLKTVELVSGQRVLYPFLMYYYLGLECSIQSLLISASFVNACEYWRTRHVPNGVYKDVYDGSFWKSFMD